MKIKVLTIPLEIETSSYKFTEEGYYGLVYYPNLDPLVDGLVVKMNNNLMFDLMKEWSKNTHFRPVIEIVVSYVEAE